MQFINITDSLKQYSDHIDRFLDNLDSEKKYFSSISKEMIQKSDMVVVAEQNGEIVGVSGFEKKYFIKKSYILIKRGYHGKGFGKNFKIAQLDEAKKKIRFCYGNDKGG